MEENNYNDLGINISASVTPVAPSQILPDGYEFSNSNIIPSTIISGSYAPQDPNSSIELFIYDLNGNIISNNYNYTNWTITENSEPKNIPTTFTDDQGLLVQNTSSANPLTTNTIEVNPVSDALEVGIDSGEIYTLYNFYTNELGSSNESTFYISDISSDRTEIRLKSNIISNEDVIEGYNGLKEKLSSPEYFDEFYVNFFNNEVVVGINILLEDNGSILIKLFEPLLQNITTTSEVYVVTKPSETIAYQIDFYQDFTDLFDNATYIKGPNVNISLQDLVNNSTNLQSYNDLTNTVSSQSLDATLNVLNKTGVTITPNYSYDTFNEFVNFSSAKQRILNFYDKVKKLQSYQNDIEVLVTTTSSNPNTVQISQSLASLQTNVTNIVSNFDGYENHLYYGSGSTSYPKTGSAYPWPLKDTNDVDVLSWIGDDTENSQYYGGYVLSSSLYDENNQNWLYYTIPTFITENSDNEDYTTFSNMVGQHFDEIWLYTRALSERFNTENAPDRGLPLNLSADAIKGLGFETFGNNYNNQDNFIGLTGEDNGSYVPPTGEELIINYIAINGGRIANYWNIGYAWEDYVEEIFEPGWPYAIDKVSKEIYKRLYHNMAYLTKKKGTISGLRQLINIWGIPNTILRINEFGGKNRDNSDDYDLWYKRYSYAFNPIGKGFNASASIRVPWMPLERNYTADSEYIVPDGIAMRFKTPGHPTSTNGGSYYSQSLMVKKSNGVNDDNFDWGVGLFYEDQPTGTHLGSSNSDYYNYGKLRFYISGSVGQGGVVVSNDIELPFFDGGWWSVLLQRDQHTNNNNQPTTYTLYVGNKQDNGWDGNNIGWTGSVSVDVVGKPTVNESWNNFGTSDVDGVYIGGHISGSQIEGEILSEGGKIFSGSLQEFRYYSHDVPQEVFNDFVMNPESIEGNNITGSESSFDIIAFRAPLGNELESVFTSSDAQPYSETYTSLHPAVSAKAQSLVTQSFIDPSDDSTNSDYEFIHFESPTYIAYSEPNVETYFLDQSSIGVRNRVSNKIQIDDADDYGTTLSRYRSIQQDYLISRSYTEDITSLEVGFSPQDEVNDDIIASFGYGVVSDTIADPRSYFDGTETYYPKLRNVAEDYFKKYTESNVWDYIRLIKYFDNSIFKAIKAYVPARTSVTTGVIVKQHMLERNRRVPVTIDSNTTVAYTIEGGMNTPLQLQNLEITSSLQVEEVNSTAAGSVPNLEGNISSSGAGFNIVPITQSWTANHNTISGSIEYVDHTQNEFFNGEFSGSVIEVTDGTLLNNPFSPSQTVDTLYSIEVTSSVGKWQYRGSGGNAITTYPSYSVGIDFIQLEDQSYSLDGFNTYLDNNGGDNQMVMIVQRSSVDTQDRYWIQGIAIPMVADSFSGNTSIIRNYFNSDGTTISYPNNIPQPPLNTSPLSGLKGGYGVNNLGPYFRLDLDNNTIAGTVDTGTPGAFIPDTGLSGLSSGIIPSVFLGDNSLFQRTYHSGNGTLYAVYYCSSPTNSPQRPIFLNGSPDTPTSFFTNGTATLYVSNYDWNYSVNPQTVATEFGKSWFIKQQSEPPGIGTGSLFLQGTTWTGSSGDFGYFAPFGLTLNDKNYTLGGEILNNQNTLINDPSFTFKVFESSSGVPTTTDNNGLLGYLFSQDSTSYETFNVAVNDPDFSSFGFEYDAANSRGLSGSAEDSTDGLYFPEGLNQSQFLNFTPYIPISEDFYNTAYNPIINNASNNVSNTHTQIIEYDNGPIPSNIDNIISGSAQKAPVPDSFYTQKSIITPRYLGSKLKSNTYNFITSTVNDSKPGTMKSTNTPISTVWKAPIYFAHFTSGKENYELWDSYTYNIDALIEVPLEDITGDNAPDLPTIINVDGGGDNITNVRSTFEVDRYSSISYNVLEGSNGIVPNNVGTYKIYQGSMEYDTIITSEVEKNLFSMTASFVTSSQVRVDSLPPSSLNSYDVDDNYVYTYLTASSYPQSPTSDPTWENGGFDWMVTGSGELILKGGALGIQIDLGKVLGGSEYYYGPSLGLLHSYNTWVKQQVVAQGKDIPGFPSESVVNPNDNANYFTFNCSASTDVNYRESNIPFCIQKGDEIRVTYDVGDLSPNFIHQDFIVTSVPAKSAGVDFNDIVYEDGGTQGIQGQRIYNTLRVTPDPSTLELPIEAGSIDNFTIRRRVGVDNKVVIYQTPPVDSQGINTPTPSGYLIPNDLTPIQKKNVQSLITQLNAKNTFNV